MRYRRLFPLLLTALLILPFCVTGAAAIEKPLTQAQSDLTAEGALDAGCSESALGNLLADAALEETGAQMAILPAGVMTGTLEKERCSRVMWSASSRKMPSWLRLGSPSPTLPPLLEQGVSKLSRNESEQIDADLRLGRLSTGGRIQLGYDVSAPEGSGSVHPL